MIDELRRQVERITPDVEAFKDRRPPEAPGLEREQQHERIAAPADRLPFGRWLLAQEGRTGFVGDLIMAAKADKAFPKDGDPEAVRARLRLAMAEGDMFDAVDEAELDWASY